MAEQGFQLAEAYIQLESKGFNQFKKNVKSVESELNHLGKEADRVSKKLENAFMGTTQQGGKTGARQSVFSRIRYNAKNQNLIPTGNIRAVQSGLDKIVDKLQDIETELKKIAKSSHSAFGDQGLWRDQNGRLRDAKGRFAKLRDTIGGTGQTTERFNTTFRNTRYSLIHAGYALQALPKDIRFAVSGFSDLGTAIAGGIGAIPALVSAASLSLVSLTSLTIKAVDTASKLETGLAEVATISKEVSTDIDGFATKLGKLSIDTRTESGLLSEGLYQTISAGITDTADAMKFLEVAANSARAGLSSVEVSVDGLSSVVNAFGYDASEVGDIADKFFKTVEVGKLKFSDLARNIGKVAPLASNLNVSLEEVLATGAALTQGGVSLSQSFTQLRSVMTAVLKPSSTAQQTAKELGLEFNAAALASKGLAGFIEDVSEKTGNSGEKLAKLFGNVRGLSGILALAGKQSDAFNESLKLITNSTGATDNALSIMNSTFKSQVDLLKTQVSFVLQQIGAELLPVLTEELGKVSKVLMETDWDEFRQGVSDTVEVMKTLYGITKESVKVLGDLGKNLPFVKAAGIARDAGVKAGQALREGDAGYIHRTICKGCDGTYWWITCCR